MRQWIPIEWHKSCRELAVKFRILPPTFEQLQERTRLERERQELNLTMLKAKMIRFREILANVSFENKDKYILGVTIAIGGRFLIHVRRKLISTTTGKPDVVNNSKVIPANSTPDDFVQALFVAIGQFEAHEFMESFRVYGTLAYFPHDTEGVKSHYKAGHRANMRILEPWRDVAYNRSDLSIAMRHLKSWIRSTAPIRTAIAIDAALVRYMDRGLKLVRLALVTAIAMPSYIRAVVLVPQNSLQDSQNSSKDKAA